MMLPTRFVKVAVTLVCCLAIMLSSVSCDSFASPPAPLNETLNANTPVAQVGHPFPKRIDFGFQFPRDATWLNTDGGALRMDDLKGKYVLLDFWTYCCINCIHILPELKKLEREFPNELVVIGVHSAKFETEKDEKNITEAILRYEIEHPVVNDPNHRIWNALGVSSWPTALLIDPEGKAVWMRSGEFKFEDVEKVIKGSRSWYKKNHTLNEDPIHFNLHALKAEDTPLRYPGKVVADEELGQLFIADSNHNRIVITTLDGQLIEIIGSSKIGKADGTFAEASFDHPQGMFRHGDWLYIADTENHLLRKANLKTKEVTTIAGTGTQATTAFPGSQFPGRTSTKYTGRPLRTGLNSPWDLWVHKDDLYIAMAGPHQIWKMPLHEGEIGPYAGNGREDIVDGPLLPKVPYEMGFSSFAQPSGLSSDGTWLFVADSEGSSIRAVPFDDEQIVDTVVGTSSLPYNRLFSFGDNDGSFRTAKFQHPLGVVYLDRKIYVADTYNNKIRVIDIDASKVSTLAGTGEPGTDDSPAKFDEPAGMSLANGKLYVADTNNHLIRTVDIATGDVATLTIDGLTPPEKEKPTRPSFEIARKLTQAPAKLKAVDGKIQLDVSLQLPRGWKINPNAPTTYYIDATDASVIDVETAGTDGITLDQGTGKFSIPVSAKPGDSEVTVSLIYYYCQDGGEGLCKVGSVVWTIPVNVGDANTETSTTLQHFITP